MSKVILIVEDEKDIREIIEYLLTDSGYQVNTSPSATDFFKKIELISPDLIILDIMLPDGDGREICRALKANIRTKEIPVIMMSAHLDVSKSIRDVGANDFMPKPFDIQNLLDRVDKQLLA